LYENFLAEVEFCKIGPWGAILNHAEKLFFSAALFLFLRAAC
jgi:uncharacterized membrane protein YiaA